MFAYHEIVIWESLFVEQQRSHVGLVLEHLSNIISVAIIILKFINIKFIM